LRGSVVLAARRAVRPTQTFEEHGMNNSILKTLGKDLDLPRRANVEKAIERAIDELKQALETGQHDADEALSASSKALGKAAHTLAEETRRRSKDLAKATTREFHDRPIATTAIVTALFAAAAGLALLIGQGARKS